jgi:hypothetical protein
MIACPEISVTKYQSMLRKIPPKTKISLTPWWKPEAFKISWLKNARQSGSPQTTQLSLGFTHQPHWIVTENEAGLVQVFKQDGMCAE